jgi:hypothetical protein
MQSALYKELYSPDGQVVPMVVWAVRLARGCGLVRFAPWPITVHFVVLPYFRGNRPAGNFMNTRSGVYPYL